MEFFFTFIIVFILVALIVFSLKEVVWPFYQAKLAKKLLKNPKIKECERLESELKWRNLTVYFWTVPVRFLWITIILFFLIALSLSIDHIIAKLFGIFFAILTIIFFKWAHKSYKDYPKHAEEELKAFEKDIEEGIKKEISFEGDNIQKFSNEDEEFDTQPKIFKFPVDTVKEEYPLFSGKKTIVHKQKLEFLILSRDYLSICKGATPFNLLDPVRIKTDDVKKDPKKKCGRVKKAGECHEYYYSLIKNVKYEDGGIKIFFHSGEEPVFFKCKKDPKAIKALQEKLRLTERQRLQKIDEQYHYETIKGRRNRDKKS